MRSLYTDAGLCTVGELKPGRKFAVGLPGHGLRWEKAHPAKDFDHHHGDLSRKMGPKSLAQVLSPIFKHRRLRSTLVSGVMCR